MKTQYLKISGEADNDERIIKAAAEIIADGGLVAIPTETVYGLAGSALLEKSAAKIYEAKGRPSDNPLIVHIAYPDEAERIAYTNPTYYALAEKFMPGPLTIILPKRDIIPKAVTGGLDSVAIRCPSNPVAHRLIEVSGHPIAAPSANRSGIPSPTRAEHVLEDMDGRIDMIIDGGPCEIGLESTVIKLDDDGCTILRPGAITEDMLGEICENVRVAAAVVKPALAAGTAPESPGMKYKHYSPNAEVILIDADDEAFIEYVNNHAGDKIGVMAVDEDAARINGVSILSLGEKGDAAEASRRLFTLLRKADELGLDKVYAMIPEQSGMYLAFYNRIIRAAGGKITKL